MADTLSRQLRYIVPKLNEKYVREVFVNTAKEVFRWLESQTYYTNRTYNLSDSVGVGIYKQGTLVKWITNPSAKATSPRLITHHGWRYHVDGRSLLQSAIRDRAGYAGLFADYTLVVFAAAPYGAWVDLSLGDGGSNKAGKGWWSDGLVPHVKDTFRSEFNKIFNKSE